MLRKEILLETNTLILSSFLRFQSMQVHTFCSVLFLKVASNAEEPRMTNTQRVMSNDDLMEVGRFPKRTRNASTRSVDLQASKTKDRNVPQKRETRKPRWFKHLVAMAIKRFIYTKRSPWQLCFKVSEQHQLIIIKRQSGQIDFPFSFWSR